MSGQSFDPLHHSRPFYLRPPPDEFLRKERPIVNSEAPKETGIAELIARGHQLIEELDKAHSRLQEAAEEALSPDPRAWRGVRVAMTNYTAAYAELTQLSKRLNRLIAEEHPEMIQPPVSPKPSIFESE